MGKKLIMFGCLLGGLIFFFGYAFPEPRFAVRTGSRCDVCHINPTGGGMRNDYGALNYSVEELPLPKLKKRISSPKIDRALSQNLQFGSDFRMLYYNVEGDNTFFQMQADLYLYLILNENLSAYLRKGIYQDFEAFGMVRINQINSYLKFGYFYPPYGLKFAEHDVFPRQELGLGPHSNDTGLELGFEPSFFSFALGVLNGTPSTFDENRNKALYFRSLYATSIKKFNFLVGASIRNMKIGNLGEEQNYTSAGEYIGFNISKLTLLTEIDWIWAEKDQSAFWAEGSFIVTQGIDLRTGYEYFNPDLSLDSAKRERLSLGVAFFPIPWSELQMKYRIALGESSEKDRLFLIIHLFM